MKPILVANWKNYPTSISGATSLVANLSRRRVLYKKTSLFIAPPFPYFEMVAKKVKSIGALASQDIFNESDGRFTGYVTAEILKTFGTKLSIIGHSERRAQGETDTLVALKVKKALSAGIVPVLCIGEKVHDVEGEHFRILDEQIKKSLEGVKKEEAKKIIIAYEPIWAIGKKAKDAMSPKDLTQMVIFIRKVLTEVFSREVAERIAILYGGSVEPANVKELFTDTGIKGFLIGHASLEHKSLAAIAEALT